MSTLPTVHDRADRLAAISIFAALLFSYAYFFGGSGFNQNATFDLTRSLVERHRLDIDPYASNTADVSFHDGHVYANKAPGLAFAAAAPYAVIHAIAGPPQDSVTLNLYLYLCTVAICGMSGAIIGVLLYGAFRRRSSSPAHAFALSLVCGLGTPLFAYSTMLFVHVPSAMLVLLAFLLIFDAPRPRPIATGAALGAATMINYLCAPLALLLLLCAMKRSERPLASALQTIAGGAPFAFALAAYQGMAFGSPIRTSIATMNPAFVEQGAVLGVFHLPRLDALWGVTFSPFRGLFYISPILLLAAAGVTLLKPRLQLVTIAVAFALLLLLNSSFNGWHGGYAVGPRYLIPAIPLLALGLPGIASRVRLLTIALCTISLVFNFAVTAVDPQPPDTLRDPIVRYAMPSLLMGRVAEEDASVPVWIRGFYTGHTSTNRVAADEMLPFKKHMPGSAASEWASFNLGELLWGPGTLASIFPWIAIVLAITITTRAWLRRSLHDSRTTPDTQTERSHSV